jgi:ATP-dependent Zn protease
MMRRPSSKTARVVLPLIVLVVLFGLADFRGGTRGAMRKTSTTDLSVLMARIEQRPGSIERVVFNPAALQVTATLTSGDKLQTNYPSDQSALMLQNQLQKQRVDFASKGLRHGSALTSILSFLLPILLLTGIFIFLTRRRASRSRTSTSMSSSV